VCARNAPSIGARHCSEEQWARDEVADPLAVDERRDLLPVVCALDYGFGDEPSWPKELVQERVGPVCVELYRFEETEHAAGDQRVAE
jgi:hypothetical protein